MLQKHRICICNLLVIRASSVLYLCCVERNPSASLFQNDNKSSKYNDILAQHATWHYRLNAKKFESMNRNWQVGDFSKFIKGKHGFYNGGKLKNLKSHFWPEKLANIGPEYTKRCRIEIFGGVCFLRKVYFVDNHDFRFLRL